MKQELTRDEAAEIFVRAVAKTGLSSHTSVIEGLQTGIPKQPYGRLKTWYDSLPEESQENVRQITHLMMDQSLFSMLCLLDGVAGHERVDEKPVHFAVFFETYSDMDALLEDKADSSVHLNPSLEPEHLHDLFADIMESTKR